MLKGQIKKKALLEEAEKLFFTKGYNRTGVQELVDAFHCTKGSFYHHFESKLQILGDVCALRSERAFAQYREQHFARDLDRLNGLLYYALPFRKGEEQMMALILPLAGSPDSDVVMQAVLRAQESFFRPEMEEILSRLKADGVFHYYQESLPQLLWDTYCALYMKLLTASSAIAVKNEQPDVAGLLNSARFIWERLLDAPYGSIHIIHADEVIAAARDTVQRMQDELNGAGGQAGEA
ncbi:MAG: hypothetical protein CW338_03520 [Clostridiales bacterium]|nr:hypothetical protein [Clostridiales bacterium]